MKKQNVFRLVSVLSILVLAFVFFGTGNAQRRVHHSDIPTVAPMPDPAPAPNATAPVRRIVSDSYSQSRSSAAIDAACRLVMQSHVKLAAGKFDRANAGVCCYSDGTFDVSGQVSWMPSGQTVPVVSFFKATVWEKDGDWRGSEPQMSGFGF